MTEKKQLSLFTRTALMILGGVLMTMVLYTLFCLLGHWLIESFYMAEDAVQARNRALAENLQQYVKEHDVHSTDYESIEAWFSDDKQADLILYGGDTIVEAGTWGYEELPASQLKGEDPAQWGYTTFPITFADGVCRTAVADASDLMLRSTSRNVSAVLSFIVFVATLLLYTRRISAHIRSFSRDVAAVSSGETDHVAEQRGFSELDSLARDVNHMHDVITQQTGSAKDAMKANSELITALSHDIRNPLTSLIGYLDLLSMESESLTEPQRQYLAASAEKADRIRVMTDEMFRYFLIFSDEKPHVQTERFDAQILLEQMLGEYAIELESQGYTVISKALETPCSIDADIQMLHRVLENFFSNIHKYADAEKPVFMTAYVRERMLHVRIMNYVDEKKRNSVESNRVGLRTCAAMLELLNGTMRIESDEETFAVEFTLPITEKGEIQ